MALRAPRPDDDRSDAIIGENAVEDALIERYVEREPYQTADEARLGDYGMSVTAVIMARQAEEGDIERAAYDYTIPVEAVEAAIAFYKRHTTVIDARITLNMAQWDE